MSTALAAIVTAATLANDHPVAVAASAAAAVAALVAEREAITVAAAVDGQREHGAVAAAAARQLRGGCVVAQRGYVAARRGCAVACASSMWVGGRVRVR